MVFETASVYLSVRASTPGSFLPSRNSRLAPPPVEMWVILSATPAFFTAETESPPPMMEMALESATACAILVVPTAKAGISKTPMGPFQMMVLAVGDFLGEERDGLGADVEGHPVSGEGTVAFEDLRGSVGGELVGEDVVDGQQEANSLGCRFGEGFLGGIDLVRFEERLAGVLPLGLEEGVGHAAADEERVDFAQQILDDLDLVRDFGAAEDGYEGALGCFESLAHVVEFLVHEQAGGGLLDEVGDAFG